MDHLKSRAFTLIESSLSTSTRQTYAAALRSFQQFRTERNIPLSWPANVDTVLCYIAEMYEKSAASSTVALHLSALARHHKVNSWDDPTGHFLVRKCIQGFKRDRLSVDTRRPVTIDILRNLPRALHHVCKSDYEKTLFTSMFTLAFFGFLRIGEIALVSKKTPDRPLKLTDVDCKEDSLILRLSISKTDQSGKGISLIIPSKADYAVCPVRALRQYMSRRPASSNQLFIHLDGSPVSRYQFSALLQKALTFLNIPSKDYKSHSFRIGAATFAAKSGISHSTIATWGRWKSAAYISYIRLAL